ncbi:MAG: DEAD/DEAH box helicase [Pseudomonadota bacterium]|nr:DEAD/DEAH box helicase [Pseudomonadota bacterium]
MSGDSPLRPDLAQAIGNLKGFQRNAVDYAFERLFLAKDSSHRFLIADEVGLGKTLIARGVVARAIDHMWDTVDRIDVLYVCSNLAIARQNLQRLNPFRTLAVPEARRITLLPISMAGKLNSKVNLLAFTPGTSLDIKENLGTQQERMLLFALISEIWDLPANGLLRVLQGQVFSFQRFAAHAKEFWASHQEALAGSGAILNKFSAALRTQSALRSQFSGLCKDLEYSRKLTPDERSTQRSLVGNLRSILAGCCIDSLEPDLIILDEFQRFKDLFNPETDAGELAQQLFNWTAGASGTARAHMLLLSATPYKPLAAARYGDDENHYEDFIRTVEFLSDGTTMGQEIRADLEAMRRELFSGAARSQDRLFNLKQHIESNLRCIMSRTERLAAKGIHNGMLSQHVRKDLQVGTEDLRQYANFRAISEAVAVDEPLEYWKSAAWPLNFMEGYKLRREFEHAAKERESTLHRSLVDAAGSLLTRERVESRTQGLLANARLRQLEAEIRDAGLFDLLWLPPSQPCGRLAPEFQTAHEKGVTKRLIFSAWNMVPKSIAALLSICAERHVDTLDQRDGEAAAERSELLRLTLDQGRLAGMPVLATMYPSLSLATLGDPRHAFKELGDDMQPAHLLEWASRRIKNALAGRITIAGPGETSDPQWYWAAPLILDAQLHPDASTAWATDADLGRRWKGSLDTQGADSMADAGWEAHVDKAQECLSQAWKPDGPAPADLPEVLAELAVGGSANCALRALSALYPQPTDIDAVRIGAANVGWSMRSFYNRPMSIALARRGDHSTPFWRLSLRYGVGGGLDAVLREYMHVLRDATGTALRDPAEACGAITTDAATALSIRTSTLAADEFHAGAEGMVGIEQLRLRCLFAMRFGTDTAKGEDDGNRDTDVRMAFNSPFWPFVLASTSVGQEGLDFHWYCHAIVHWNLPSNPVDLEQREGRIHRFKGHAIRRNVARIHGAEALRTDAPDMWEQAFSLAESHAQDRAGGLIPHWLYTCPGGATIERHVPLYPLSRDEHRYEGLRRALGAYRLAFGQPRQDELLAYLLDSMTDEQLSEMMETLRIDLSPPGESVS